MAPSDYPVWSFDGSSTLQAEAGKGKNTDCLLKPVFVTYDPLRGGVDKLVLCEVLNPDGTPHKTNTRYWANKIFNKDYFNKYPYKLSPFQKYSIEATIEGHHTLITAHTGSGKTLPAEFAIEYFVSEISKDDNKNKIKHQVIDPIFMYIIDKVYPYVIISSVIFILIFLISGVLYPIFLPFASATSCDQLGIRLPDFVI